MRSQTIKTLIDARLIGVALFLLVGFGTVAQSAMAQNLPEDYDIRHSYGLTDLGGRELLPAIYQDIRYIGHGLFLLSEQKRENQSGSEKKFLMNTKLREVATAVPPQTAFRRILWLGARADKTDDPITRALPDDALLVFGGKEGLGVCSSKGKEILPADCVWIGNFSNNLVAIRRSDGFLYTFNFRNRQLTKFVFQDVRKDCRLDFSEGLAAFATKSSAQSRSRWGFIDTDGRVVIEPIYDFAWDFVDGFGCVRISAGVKPAYNALVDKHGAIVSHKNIEVVLVVGPHRIVRNSAGLCGVVDRNFDYVVEPKYKSIRAQSERPATVDEMGVWYSREKKPIFYFAITPNDECLVLSDTGKLVLKIPDSVGLKKGWFPIFSDGAFACNFGPGAPLAKATFINLKGEVVPAPFSNLAESPDI